MKKHILPLCCSFILLSSAAPKPVNEALKWSSLAEVSEKIKQEQKPVLIDVYTNWCHWCKVMDKKTYGNQKVIRYVQEHFYSAKLNAETKENLTWATKTYSYNNNYSVNQFVLYATNGQTGFPSTVILTSEKSQPVSVPGFLEPGELEPILKYFGEGAYKSQTFPEFKKNFKASW